MTKLVQNDQMRSSFSADERESRFGLVRNQFALKRVSLRRPLNMGFVADRAAETWGDDPALYLDKPFDWDPLRRLEMSYAECADLVEKFSGVFAATGLSRWDRIAILKSPNYDVNCIAWGAARIGVIPALLSPGLDPSVVRVLLTRLQPRLLVTDDITLAKMGLERGFLDSLGCRVLGKVSSGIALEEVWGASPPPPNPLKDDEPMIITHTSSTTGISKLAEASAIGVTKSAELESLFPYAHGRHELFASVISHVHVRGTVTQTASFSRGTPVLGISTDDSSVLCQMLIRYRPTIVEAHPNAFVSWEPLTKHPEEPFRSVRLFFNTFDAIHPRTVNCLLAASKRRFPIWLQNYGMTETQPVSVRPYTRRLFPMTPENARSVGWPVPRVRVRIADLETGERRQRTGNAGLIQVKTGSLSLSFVGTPEKYSERRHGKWFDTGDWGRRDRLGRLEILDRVADRIPGIESCLQIEDALLSRIPTAEEIVIVSDDQGRAVPIICIREGEEWIAASWSDVTSGLPDLQPPVFVDRKSLSRTATVKARRFALSELVKRRSEGDLQSVLQIEYPEGA